MTNDQVVAAITNLQSEVGRLREQQEKNVNTIRKLAAIIAAGGFLVSTIKVVFGVALAVTTLWFTIIGLRNSGAFHWFGK